MLFLKQSTASQSVKLGPFVDSTDGVTAETGLTIANTDIKLSKAGGTMAAKNSGGGTHDADGWYTITLDATDTNTVGALQVSCKVAGACPVWAEFQVLEEAIYDALIAASASAFDSSAYVKGVSGTLNTLDALDTAQDSQHSSTQALVTTVDTVVDGIQTDLSNGTDGLGAIKTAVDAIPTSNPTAAAIADAVWDEAQADHVSAGSFGETATEIASILADTNELQTNQGNWLTATGFSTHSAADVWAAATRTLTANTNLNDPTAAAIADAVWDELQSGHVTGGSFGEIATEIASILADTNELQTDWANGGRLDLIVDGILEDTGTTLPASISGLNNLSAAQVNAEVLDVLATDTFAEPASVPAATASLKDKIGWLAALSRNKITSTATTKSLRNDADSGNIAQATHSDDGTTYTSGEWS